MEEIRILAPARGRCPLCAERHRPEEPHEANSLYYIMRFRRVHKRMPTWADAMRHCPEEIRAAFAAQLKERGIETDTDGGNG